MPDNLKPRCPECGKPMHEREDGSGKFFRCDAWRICKGKLAIGAEPPQEPKAATDVSELPLPAPAEPTNLIFVNVPIPTTNHVEALGLAVIESDLPEAVAARAAMAKEARLKAIDRIARELQFLVRAKHDKKQEAKIVDAVDRLTKLFERNEP